MVCRQLLIKLSKDTPESFNLNTFFKIFFGLYIPIYAQSTRPLWRTKGCMLTYMFWGKLQHFVLRSKVFFILDTFHSLLTYAWSLLNSAQIRYRGHQFASLSLNFLGEGLRIPTNEREGGGYPSILCPTWPLGPRKLSSAKKSPPLPGS